MRSRYVLLPCLIAAVSSGCDPDSDREPFTQANVPVETLRGYYEVEVAPEASADWPAWKLGPTDLKVDIRPGPDPMPPEDPWLSGALPAAPPYRLMAKAPVAEQDGRTAPRPTLTPLSGDGTSWKLGALDLSARGVWTLEVEVSNPDNVIDTVEFRFEVE